MFDNFFKTISEISSVDFIGFFNRVEVAFKNIDVLHDPLLILDIIISAVLIYFSLVFLKKLKIFNLIWGVILLVVLYIIAKMSGLILLLFILKYFSLFLVVVVPFFIVPKLRRALDRVDKEIGGVHFSDLSRKDKAKVVEEISRAVGIMAEKRLASIIVLENKDNLSRYAGTGVKMEAKATAEFLINIFFAGSSLRQGATIVRGDEIIACKCMLPLTNRRLYMDHIDPRDKAAIGLAEVSDALSFVTSEKRGDISIAYSGSYVTKVDPERLESIILSLLSGRVIGKKIDIK
jgi:diadenylate cyclase